MISHQLRPSNQPITKNHHLQTQFEGLTIKSDPQVGRQTLNKFDYPNKLISFPCVSGAPTVTYICLTACPYQVDLIIQFYIYICPCKEHFFKYFSVHFLNLRTLPQRLHLIAIDNSPDE